MPADPLPVIRCRVTRAEADQRAVLAADNYHEEVGRQRSFALATVALLFVSVFASGRFYPRNLLSPSPVGLHRAQPVRTGIDPNSAHWFEIAQLPGIGETLALRIVAFREARQSQKEAGQRVFQRPDDLTGVKGIGVKKVRRMRPSLRFWPTESGD